MDQGTIRVLLIDDDQDDYVITRALLSDIEGMRIDLDWSPEYEQALALMRSDAYDAYLIDYRLGRRNGLELMHDAVAAGCSAPMIILTGQGDRDVDVQAMQAGAVDYLVKDGLRADMLDRTIRYAMERMQTLQALQQKTRLNQLLLDALPYVAMLLGADGTVIAANQPAIEARAQTGQPYCSEPTNSAGTPQARSCSRPLPLDTGQTVHGEVQRDDQFWDIYWTRVEPELYLYCAFDITARRRSEEQLRQHEADLAHVSRLSTMGEMASGLAHELNQPLAAIVNYTRGCVRRVQSGQSTGEALIGPLERAAAQAERAAKIIRRFRAFVRKGEQRRSLTDLNHVAREVVGLAEHEIRQNAVEVRLDLAESLPLVQADVIQIEQVLLNLVRNAIEAMNVGPIARRELVIRTRVANNSDAAVEVAVRDCGCGLNEELAARAFDPFFTTKPNGMGMGLCISQSIIETHGGHLWAQPNEDVGSTFSFTLPANTGAEKHEC